MTSMHDVIILGAGVAGLQCARRLRAAGADVLVVDRADKPGGRCATRSFDGQQADYGPLFVHGHDAGFLAAVAGVGSARLEGWPARVSGRGAPCQPDAFAAFQTRAALVDGVNTFPAALSQGLAIRLRALAVSIGAEKDGMVVTLADGETLRTRDLVLAMALEQSAPFLRNLEPAPGVDSARGVLEMFASLPCLTLIAGYEPGVPRLGWDVCYPEDEPALLLMSNESSKRPGQLFPVVVFQASARWSMERLARPKEEWGRELLDVAARRLGSWAGAPAWTHLHRWRYSRLDRCDELAAPLELRLGASRVAVIGDLFAPGGGLQAAWLSGDRLGSRLAGEP
ncbi:MAG: NAD(P)/FAD-dependent oxidoreductase [Spirochaetia bacterium]